MYMCGFQEHVLIAHTYYHSIYFSFTIPHAPSGIHLDGPSTTIIPTTMAAYRLDRLAISEMMSAILSFILSIDLP
ncbi:hypothetical protein Hanom_Chr02g00097311 [Helianthus anomalus]